MMYERSEELWSLLFGSSVDVNDIQRWTSQKLTFHESSIVLAQRHGGPCGVLAPIQAFLILELVKTATNIDALKSICNSLRDSILQNVIIHVLQRALPVSNFPIIYLHLESIESKVFSIRDTFDVSDMTAFDLVASIVASRTIDQVYADMDDSSVSLIERFGHCSQELLNLVLIGRAVSNVFDRDKPMGDTGMVLHGIPDEALVSVGLLSELEHLRYVTVGQKLKNPLEPFWIIGSSSHYTVLFSFEKSACYVPPSDLVKERIHSKFNSLQFDQGLMDESRLNELAQLLHLPPPEFGVRNELCQSGVVILDDVLRWASPQLITRPEFSTEEVHDVTKEYEQLYLVNNQTPEDIYSIRIFGSGGSSCSDPALLGILQTRWPNKGIVVDKMI
jgi:hypothetical protein